MSVAPVFIPPNMFSRVCHPETSRQSSFSAFIPTHQRGFLRRRDKKTCRVLGIETSCDETSVALVTGPDQVISCVISSSLDEHARFGGVIPEIASRAHLESIVSVTQQAIARAKINPQSIDAIAVTHEPGLIGSLLVGISFARALAMAWQKPIISIDHVKAHLYAPFIDQPLVFPFAGLVVSGGHTHLFHAKKFGCEKVIGLARDDAAGEAFDKVAKILGLSYPGGPIIEQLALKGRPGIFKFNCNCGNQFDFSFSGIKTAVLYKVAELKRVSQEIPPQAIYDICAAFQESVVEDLIQKSLRAVKKIGAQTLAVGGGVAFNNYLRRRLELACREADIRLCIASKPYCLDNAAMVASLGARMHLDKLAQKKDRA